MPPLFGSNQLKWTSIQDIRLEVQLEWGKNLVKRRSKKKTQSLINYSMELTNEENNIFLILIYWSIFFLNFWLHWTESGKCLLYRCKQFKRNKHIILTLWPNGKHVSWNSWTTFVGAFTPAINSVNETICNVDRLMETKMKQKQKFRA